MNTIEISYKKKIKNWNDLIKAAKNQFIQYEKVEGIDWGKYDFSIDCAEDQMKFKDMLQIRCIEELTEASIAFKEGEYEHFKEEISDVINFFLSAMIMIDYKLEEPILSNEDQSKLFFGYMDELDIHHYFYIIIEKIGYLCNLLKNRPWAQSNYLVSMIDFNERCEDLYKTFWDLISSLGFSKLSILEMFERKYEVNKWRMKTGY